MRKMLSVFAILLVSMTLWAGVGSAAYLPEYDTYIRIETNGNMKNFPLDESTAQAMFERQEKIHEKITKVTGKEIDHSYIWIVINGKTVLAVDPPLPGV
ncbi:8-amino-7-oxononanoate synthase [Neobacillus niacini]|uniref:8-amino-7-oxononanoate synthase n=1 Tax=Neobacillus niacini TaxID=86668 RepID=UPI0021CB0B28|nr:8-amino-7-oxononanoate synthase [Neobacillus niacini]MCM3766073.1 8-amino-7-oxononanoate synthase [Neobacillus niacini]